MFGEVHAEHFRLYASTVLARNSFRRLFNGHLEAAVQGTRIDGEFRVHVFVGVFMVIWLAFSGALALLFCLAALSPTGPTAWEAVGPSALFLFGLGMLYVGPRLSSSEEAAVLSYICERLEAVELAA